MNKQMGTMLVIIIIVFLFLVVTQFPPLWSLMSPRAPRPEITQGEFAFRLEYEIHGERIIIEDAIIAEHDGTSWDAGTGNHNVWSSHLMSGNYFIELYRTDTKIVFVNILGHLRAGYLLGKENVNASQDIVGGVLPPVIRFHLDEEAVNSWQAEQITTFFSNEKVPNIDFAIGARWHISSESLFSEYGIKLISFEHEPPKRNSFR